MDDLLPFDPAPLERVALTPPQRELVEILRNIGGPVFAILDAARDPLKILATLRASGEEYQSLYEGTQGMLLEAFAPHLASLPADSLLLDHLVAHGWGKRWGIFLVSGEPFAAVRQHFRTFLMVKGPDGKELYFRYYDPSALRTYLPTCNAAETQFIFGPVAAYLCEDEAPHTLLVFQPGGDVPRKETYPLSASAKEMNGSLRSIQSEETDLLNAALSA